MANYRIVARCDAYHSAKHFSIDEKNVLERDGNTPIKWVFLKRIPSLKKAQKALLKMAEGDAEMSYPNWGIAVRHPNEDKEVECYPTRKDGTRAYRNDTITYEIEKEEVLVGLIGHYLYSSSENAKVLQKIARERCGINT